MKSPRAKSPWLPPRWFWSVVAGLIMSGWIAGEVLILDVVAGGNQPFSAYFWLQPFYFIVGVAMALLGLRLAPAGWRSIARQAHLA